MYLNLREERRNASKLYNPMRISDVSEYDPNTPWLEYINNILTQDIIQVSSLQSNKRLSLNLPRISDSCGLNFSQGKKKNEKGKKSKKWWTWLLEMVEWKE